MADLSTSYLGLKLENPVIAASSRLTYDVDSIRKCEEAGAAAVVVKSLFEEQIDSDSRSMIEDLEYYSHTDAYDYFSNRSKDYYIDAYLETVERTKREVSIPVIASVNCRNDGSWIDYAKRFEAVGADALELNIFVVPADITKSSHEIEDIYFRILAKIKQRVTIPVALKIGSHFSGLANFLHRLDEAGADGLVLFNRFYRTDIDIDSLAFKPGKVLSVPEEAAVPLQWTAIMSGALSCDICANTGIYDGSMVIKQLLAGAACVQICSAILKKNLSVIGEMNAAVSEWMDAKGYRSVSDFQGSLSRAQTDQPEVWERSQYIKAICGIS